MPDMSKLAQASAVSGISDLNGPQDFSLSVGSFALPTNSTQNRSIDIPLANPEVIQNIRATFPGINYRSYGFVQYNNFGIFWYNLPLQSWFIGDPSSPTTTGFNLRVAAARSATKITVTARYSTLGTSGVVPAHTFQLRVHQFNLPF
jgi:hypothetical protein